MKGPQVILDSNQIKADIKKFILSNFLPGDDEQSLRDDDLLFESGIIDSAGAMTFVFFLEDYFGIEILDEELYPENFASVIHIVNFVREKRQKLKAANRI